MLYRGTFLVWLSRVVGSAVLLLASVRCPWPWVCCSDVVSGSLPLPPLRVALLLSQHAEGLRRCVSPKACSCPERPSRDLRGLFFRDNMFRDCYLGGPLYRGTRI